MPITFTYDLSIGTKNLPLTVDRSEVYSQGYYEPFMPQNTNSTIQSYAAGSWAFDQFVLPYGIGSGQIFFPVTIPAGFLNGGVFSAASTGSVTRYQTFSTQAAIYKFGTGANSTRLESVWSYEVSDIYTWERRIGATTTSALTVSNFLTISFPAQYDASGGLTYSTTTASGTASVGASTGASTMADSLITAAAVFGDGLRLCAFPFATTLPPGAYYIGAMVSNTVSSSGTNYSTGTMRQTHSYVYALEYNNRGHKAPGKSTSNTSSAWPPFHGNYATTSATPPSTIATSDIRNSAGLARRIWNYQQTSY